MPNIEGYKLTNKGNALQIKVEAGKCKLNITKLKLGSGTASGDIVNLTDLVQVEQTVPISKIEVVDDYTCRITGLVTNQGLNKTYYIREIGLYAQDPDDGEILYLVAVDKNPDVMPADNYQMIISQEFNIDVVVSNVDSVNVTSQPVHLITDDELNKKIEEHNTSANPHENIFKRVLITEAKTAANTADWNTLTESRTYKISGATFAADKHQPVGAVGTGELVVLKNSDDTIAQVYYANSAAYDKAGAYHRMCISGTWTDWVYNITNKGGNITGDFNINGKLIAKEIYATDKLLIGDYDPSVPPDTSSFLTKDDFDKLKTQIEVVQNKLVDNSQWIAVDSKNGNDNNSGTSWKEAVQTLDKAISLIKKYVPTVSINLRTYTEPENEQYNTYTLAKPINLDPLGVQNFTLEGYWESYRTGDVNAKIIVPYGKKGTGIFNYTEQGNIQLFMWGNMLILGGKNINFNQITPVFPDDIRTNNNFMNAVIVSTSGIINIRESRGNQLILPADNCHVYFNYQSSSVDTLCFYLQNITGEGLLTAQSYPNLFAEDPKSSAKIVLNEIETLAETSREIRVVISKVINMSSTFGEKVLGSTKGMANKMTCVWSNL